MNGAHMSIHDKTAFPPSGPKRIIQGKDGWASMPMGRVLQWFPQPGTKERENQAGSTGVIRDHRPPKPVAPRRRLI